MNEEKTAAPEKEEPETEPKKEQSAELPDEPEGGEQSPGKNKKEEKSAKKDLARLQKEHDALKKEQEKLSAECEKLKAAEKEQNERYLRMMAEYDNFRRRTASEKDAIYADAVTDVLKEILPAVDALEMALKFRDESGESGESIKKGVEMTLSKFKDALGRLGVTEIECVSFDPNLHNAVMHVEDDEHGEGEILEVFQKGYKKGDKIIRYAMVKVAN